MTTQSDTPRTDAAIVSAEYIRREMDYYEHKFVLADWAREFEREAAQLRADRDIVHIALNAEQVHSEHMRKQNTELRADRDALADALKNIAGRNTWKESEESFVQTQYRRSDLTNAIDDMIEIAREAHSKHGAKK